VNKSNISKSTDVQKENVVPQKRTSEPKKGLLAGFSGLWKKQKVEETEMIDTDTVPQIPQQYLDKRRLELLFGSQDPSS
jgi:hypothetical protein